MQHSHGPNKPELPIPAIILADQSMWETIELREVRIFLVLANELHFGRTAERLGISQPTVTQATKTLEEQLGMRLFDRSSRRVALTDSGRRLQAALTAPADALSDALAGAYRRARRVEGTITIAVLSPYALSDPLDDLIAAFTEAHPDCEVSISDQWQGTDAITAVTAGEAELLLSWLPLHDPKLAQGPVVHTTPRVLAVGRTHPLARQANRAGFSISAEDLADWEVGPTPGWPPEIVDAIVPPVTPTGRPIPRRSKLPRGIPDALSLIARGRAVHPTAASAIPRIGSARIIAIPIHDLPPMQTALFHRHGTSETRITSFLQIAATVLDRHPPKTPAADSPAPPS